MLSVLRPSFFRSSSDCAHTAVAPDRTAAANTIFMAPPLRAGTCYARGAAYRNARSARLKIQCRPREGEWQRRSGRFWPFRTIPRTPSPARRRGFSTSWRSRTWRRGALLPPLMLAACIAVILARDGLHDSVMAAIGAVLVMGGVLLFFFADTAST